MKRINIFEKNILSKSKRALLVLMNKKSSENKMLEKEAEAKKFAKKAMNIKP